MQESCTLSTTSTDSVQATGMLLLQLLCGQTASGHLKRGALLVQETKQSVAKPVW